MNDPLKLEFTAKIIDKTNFNDGRCDVIPEQTYFYPTGGQATERQVETFFEDIHAAIRAVQSGQI